MREPFGQRSAAFDAEAVDYLNHLKALSRRLADDRSEAEDLVQEAYLRALQSSHRFTPGTNLLGWLRTILPNVASNRRRDRYRSRVRANEAEVARATGAWASSASTPEQLLLNDALGTRLQAALESMPKALRDAIWLRDVEGLSYLEIAARLRTPIGTVMSRISRGRRLLHRRLLALDGPGSHEDSHQDSQERSANDDLR